MFVMVIFFFLRFPSVHFGKLFGAVMALSAVVSLLQYPCFTLIKGPLGGDPLYVSLWMLLVCLSHTYVHFVIRWGHISRISLAKKCPLSLVNCVVIWVHTEVPFNAENPTWTHCKICTAKSFTLTWNYWLCWFLFKLQDFSC